MILAWFFELSCQTFKEDFKFSCLGTVSPPSPLVLPRERSGRSYSRFNFVDTRKAHC
jgi:hypothetical protein